MEKRLLEELTNEELKELYKVNKFLQEKAQEEAAENSNFWIDEILDNFRGNYAIEYSVGYPGNYFTFNTYKAGTNEYKDFFESLQSLFDYGVFTDETARKIKRTKEKLDIFLDMKEGYIETTNENYNRFEKWIDATIQKASEEILKYIIADYEAQFDENLIIDEFLPLFVENCGDQYETDGTFIYETECRKYA